MEFITLLSLRFLQCLLFCNDHSKSDDSALSGTGSIAPGSDMGSFSSSSKCISSTELLSPSIAKQGNGKRYLKRMNVISYYFAEGVVPDSQNR